MKLRSALIFAAAAAAAFISAAGPGLAEGLLDKARTDGIRLAYSPEPPFSFLDESGKVVGEAPTVATAVLASMGISKIEWSSIEWASLIPGLQSNRFDLIAAGMFITPQRCAVVAFSNPSFVVGQGIVAPAANPLGIHSFADIAAKPQVRFGLLSGGASTDYIKEVGIPESQVQFYPDGPSLISALQSGRVDAITMARPSLQQLLDKAADASIAMVDPYSEPDSFKGYPGFVVRQGDKDFLDAFNAALKTYLGTPAHLDAVRPYGVTQVDITDRTAASLCGT